jgi:hypothetical protein
LPPATVDAAIDVSWCGFLYISAKIFVNETQAMTLLAPRTELGCIFGERTNYARDQRTIDDSSAHSYAVKLEADALRPLRDGLLPCRDSSVIAEAGKLSLEQSSAALALPPIHHQKPDNIA